MKSEEKNKLEEKLDKKFLLSRSDNAFKDFLKNLNSADDNSIHKITLLYEKTINDIEKEIWSDTAQRNLLSLYQRLFRDLEKIHLKKTSDQRYNFKLVIPVADRPQQLQQCMASILQLCQHYNYGSSCNNHYKKISVLIADDSKDRGNMADHKKICDYFNGQGIKTDYFGVEEQYQLVKNTLRLNPDLKDIISFPANNDIYAFTHKGASVMRNITCLKLHAIFSTEKNGAHTLNQDTLIYFLDSDQEFCITTEQNSKFYGINYFHHLNKIFQKNDISILTGKVVGDPPVSPSVMANNFQQDIAYFLNTIDKLDPDEKCQFHSNRKKHSSDAAYHDMADLFGFSENKTDFSYPCDLPDKHSNRDCFNAFSEKLSHFFYGEHPTRKTYFNYDKGFTHIAAARTVYTGNYVIKPELLNQFIPFATLKLRMAGPVLGRMLQAELKEKFVSANIPMLHNRTVDDSGKSEFRSGVDDTSTKNDDSVIDLSNEFLRQFYGDIMLFSIIDFSKAGYPKKNVAEERILASIESTHRKIKENYIRRHNTIMQLANHLEEKINNKTAWWNQHTEDKTTLPIKNFIHFLNNIKLNFDDESVAYKKITSTPSATTQLKKIAAAIRNHAAEKKHWETYLK